MENIITADNVIDIRDVTDRVEHLEKLRQPGPVDLGADNETDQDELFEELERLECLLGEIRGRGGDHDWRGDWYPISLIRDGFMEDYCRELAIDCGMIARAESWPLDCIDWERATDRFKEDYSEIEFMGETYWYR